MKYCSRSASLVEGSHHALVQSGEAPDARVPVDNMCKLTPGTAHETLPAVLRDNGYETIHSGKWHLLPGDRVWELDYAEVERSIMDAGFTRVGGAYAGNVPGPDEWWKASAHYQDPANRFSHNMEWQLGEALRHVDGALGQGKPFFLYLAPTLPNNFVDYYEALLEVDPGMTPKGYVPPGERYPTGMPPREDVWRRALALAAERKARTGGYAGHLWLDDALGALVRGLEARGILDNTVLVVTTDHGMTAKAQLYEGGVRVFNFARFPGLPKLAGGQRLDDTLVANLDLGATVLDYLGLQAPYAHDGQSLLPYLAGRGEGRTRLVTEVANDRAVVDLATGLKYLTRSWRDTHEGKRPPEFPAFDDAEQLYDLAADPAEQVNLAYCPAAALSASPYVAWTPAKEAALEALRQEVCLHDLKLAPADLSGARCPAVAWAAEGFAAKRAAGAQACAVALSHPAPRAGEGDQAWTDYYMAQREITAQKKAAAAECKRAGNLGCEEEIAAAAAPALASLPPPAAAAAASSWAQYQDEASGRAYWYNAATGESSWENPAAAAAAPAPAPAAAPAEAVQASATQFIAVTVQAAPAKQKGWSKYHDEATGRAYWYNALTGASTWENPYPAAAAAATPEEAAKLPSLPQEPAAAVTPVEVVVPEASKQEEEGWAKYQDETTGQAYWFNSVTGVSTWEDPGAGAAQQQQQPPQAQSVVELRSKEEQFPYMYLAAVEPGAAVVATATELQEGWAEYRDEATGRAYWYNAATSESSWENPSAAAAQSSSAMGVSSIREEQQSSSMMTLSASEPLEHGSIGLSSAASEKGWSKNYDVATGQFYWYNYATGESTWEKPAPSAKKAPAARRLRRA